MKGIDSSVREGAKVRESREVIEVDIESVDDRHIVMGVMIADNKVDYSLEVDKERGKLVIVIEGESDRVKRVKMYIGRMMK